VLLYDNKPLLKLYYFHGYKKVVVYIVSGKHNSLVIKTYKKAKSHLMSQFHVEIMVTVVIIVKVELV
jgi:hypothetical protein